MLLFRRITIFKRNENDIMSKKMKITISFEDKNGKTITHPIEVKKDIPWIKEFNEIGFDEGFEKFEEAMLEGRQEVTEAAANEYFKTMSKKKSKRSQGE